MYYRYFINTAHKTKIILTRTSGESSLVLNKKERKEKETNENQTFRSLLVNDRTETLNRNSKFKRY
jgi:hypothetical protein